MQLKKLKKKQSTNFKTGETINNIVEYTPVVEDMEGRATIQLFEDGELVQEIVSDNFVGLSAKEFFEHAVENNLFKDYSTAISPSFDNFAPISPLTHMNLVNAPEPVERPDDDILVEWDIVGGCRTNSVSNITSGTYFERQGQFNGAESGFSYDLRRMRFVADFATDRANGTFNTVALTTRSADDSSMYLRSYSASLRTIAHATTEFRENTSRSAKGVCHYIDAEGKEWLFTVMSGTSTSHGIGIYKIPLHEGESVREIPLPPNFAASMQDSFSMWTDLENKVLNVIYSYSRTSKFRVQQINAETGEFIREVILDDIHPDMTYTADSSSRYKVFAALNHRTNKVHFLFTRGDGTIVGHVRTSINLEYEHSYPAPDNFAPTLSNGTEIIHANGKDLFYNFSSDTCNVYDIDYTQRYKGIQTPSNSSYIYTHPHHVDFEDRSKVLYGLYNGTSITSMKIIRLHAGYLGAKNCLPTPVTKTNAQTMKIIYDVFFVNRGAIPAKPNAIAPRSVQNFKATLVDSVINLSWDANNESDLEGYYVYVNDIKRMITPQKTTTYSLKLEDLSLGLDYKIHVVAVNKVGIESDYVDYFLVDRQAPLMVQNLRAIESEDNTSVTLTWTLLDDDVTYHIFRNDASIGTVENLATFTDNGLTPATQYNYFVVAVDKIGNTGVACPKVYVTMSPPQSITNFRQLTELGIIPSEENWTYDVGLSWVGTPDWTRNYVYDEKPSIRNKTISHNQSTDIGFNVTVEDPSDLVINYSMESESVDKFTVLVDGTSILSDGGIFKDKTFSYTLTPGSHAITLRYSKDRTTSKGLDSVFIHSLKVGEAPKTPTFIWDHVPEVDFGGYNIYWNGELVANTQVRKYALTQEQATQEGTHLLQVCSVDQGGRESLRISHLIENV